MDTSNEGWGAKLGALAAVVIAVVTVLSFWESHRSAPASSDGLVTSSPVPAGPSPSPPSPSQEPGSQQQGTPAGAAPEKSPAKPPVKTAEAPAEVTLHDGDQKTVLSDQASLGVAFQQIGEEEVVTVSVNGEPHAVLGTGAHFGLSVKGTSYTIYVLHVDSQGKSVRLRIAESP